VLGQLPLSPLDFFVRFLNVFQGLLSGPAEAHSKQDSNHSFAEDATAVENQRRRVHDRPHHGLDHHGEHREHRHKRKPPSEGVLGNNAFDVAPDRCHDREVAQGSVDALDKRDIVCVGVEDDAQQTVEDADPEAEARVESRRYQSRDSEPKQQCSGHEEKPEPPRSTMEEVEQGAPVPVESPV